MNSKANFMRKVWSVLAEHPNPVRFLTAKALTKSGLSKWITIRQRGFRLRFYPSALSTAFWMNRRDRQADEEFLRCFLRPGNVVVDVGANIGHLAMVAAMTVGAAGRVFAFEPHPRIFAYLQGNVALNRARNIRMVCAAVGNRNGTIQFTDGCMDDGNHVLMIGGIPVPIYRLDDIDMGPNAVSVLKIDVEGFELFVLQGGDGVLRRTNCVMFESWEHHFQKYGYVSSDIRRLLAGYGFRTYRRDGRKLVEVCSDDYRSVALEEFVALRDGEESRLAKDYLIVLLRRDPAPDSPPRDRGGAGERPHGLTFRQSVAQR